jgi:hypothetical protein
MKTKSMRKIETSSGKQDAIKSATRSPSFFLPKRYSEEEFERLSPQRELTSVEDYLATEYPALKPSLFEVAVIEAAWSKECAVETIGTSYIGRGRESEVHLFPVDVLREYGSSFEKDGLDGARRHLEMLTLRGARELAFFLNIDNGCTGSVFQFMRLVNCLQPVSFDSEMLKLEKRALRIAAKHGVHFPMHTEYNYVQRTIRSAPELPYWLFGLATLNQQLMDMVDDAGRVVVRKLIAAVA